jgi:hypothetical protein
MSESWGASSLAIGPGDRGQTYTLRFELVDSMGGSVTSTVDVDDIAFEVTTAPALPRRALVLVAALLAVAGALAAARAGARRSQQT